VQYGVKIILRIGIVKVSVLLKIQKYSWHLVSYKIPKQLITQTEKPRRSSEIILKVTAEKFRLRLKGMSLTSQEITMYSV
jgi:hypothetical protein